MELPLHLDLRWNGKSQNIRAWLAAVLAEEQAGVLFVTERVTGPTRITGMNLQCTGDVQGVQVQDVVTFAEVRALYVTKKLSLPTPFVGG